MNLRRCDQCHAPYRPKRKAQRFCGAVCSKTYHLRRLRQQRREERLIRDAGPHELTPRWEAILARFGELVDVEPIPDELVPLSVTEGNS